MIQVNGVNMIFSYPTIHRSANVAGMATTRCVARASNT
jgi:hypothetical protein